MMTAAKTSSANMAHAYPDVAHASHVRAKSTRHRVADGAHPTGSEVRLAATGRSETMRRELGPSAQRTHGMTDLTGGERAGPAKPVRPGRLSILAALVSEFVSVTDEPKFKALVGEPKSVSKWLIVRIRPVIAVIPVRWVIIRLDCGCLDVEIGSAGIALLSVIGDSAPPDGAVGRIDRRPPRAA